MSDPWDPEFHDAEHKHDEVDEGGEKHTGEPEELLKPTADLEPNPDDSPEALLHPTAPDEDDTSG